MAAGGIADRLLYTLGPGAELALVIEFRAEKQSLSWTWQGLASNEFKSPVPNFHCSFVNLLIYFTLQPGAQNVPVPTARRRKTGNRR